MFLKKFIKIVKTLRVAAEFRHSEDTLKCIKDLEVYLKGSCRYFKPHTKVDTRSATITRLDQGFIEFVKELRVAAEFGHSEDALICIKI